MRILLVTARYPWPSRRGDQLRPAQLSEFLAPDHSVTLLVPQAEADERTEPRTVPPGKIRVETFQPAASWAVAGRLIAAGLSGRPFQNALFGGGDLRARVRALAPEHDLVILHLVRLEEVVDVVDSTPLIVDFVDSLSLNFRRRARLEQPGLRSLLRWEARRLARSEARILERARGAIVVSDRDRDDLRQRLPSEIGDRIRVLPIAFAAGSAAGSESGSNANQESSRIESEAGSAANEVEAAESSPVRRERLVVTGNLGYFPTYEGLMWFLTRVWPDLKVERPQLKLRLAGSRPPKRLIRAASGAGVEVVAEPAELRTHLRWADLALAPMRCGSGQPIKILEAWAEGVPVVATPWAAAGTRGRAGIDLVVADGEAEWRREISRLLDDPSGRHRLAAQSRETLRNQYAVDTIRRQLRDLVEAMSVPDGGRD